MHLITLYTVFDLMSVCTRLWVMSVALFILPFMSLYYGGLIKADGETQTFGSRCIDTKATIA